MKGAAVWDTISVPAIEPVGWSCDERIAGLRALERIARQVQAASCLLLTAEELEGRDGVALVARTAGVSARCARERVVGARVAQRHPSVGAALSNGDVCLEHVVALAPVAEDVEAVDAVDAVSSLLALAAAQSPEEFRSTVHRYQLQRNPSEIKQRQHESRSLTFYKTRQGCVGVRGVFKPIDGEELKNRLLQITDAKWRFEHPERAEVFGAHGGDRLPARLADALMELVCGTAPTSGKPAVVITVDAATLHANIVGHGPVAFSEVADLLDRSELYAAVKDLRGEILKFGRSRRFASAFQKLAIVVRDGGCVWPGCDAHWSRAQCHHQHDYGSGGRTDIDNLVAVCARHHTHGHRTGTNVVRNTNSATWEIVSDDAGLRRKRRPPDDIKMSA